MEHRFALSDLTVGFARRAHLPQQEAETFAKLFFHQIEQGLLRENVVKVKGLGVFKLVEVEARESIDVNSGARIEINGHTKVSFTPDPVLRDAVNKPFSDFETVILNDATDLAQMEAETLPEEALQEIESQAETFQPQQEVPLQEESQHEVPQQEEPQQEEPQQEEPQQPLQEPSVHEPKQSEPQAEELAVSSVVESVEEEVVAVQHEEPQPAPLSQPASSSQPVSSSQPAVVEETPLVQKAAVVEEAELVRNAHHVDTHPHHGWSHFLFGLLAAIVFLGIGFAIGFYLRPVGQTDALTEAEKLWLQERRAQEARAALQASKAPSKAVPAAATAKKDTTHNVADTTSISSTKKQPSEVLAYPQLEGGEYLIVGIKGTEVMTPGKTLLNISLKYYKSKDFVPYICTMNGIKNPDVVPLNKELKIPELKLK